MQRIGLAAPANQRSPGRASKGAERRVGDIDPLMVSTAQSAAQDVED